MEYEDDDVGVPDEEKQENRKLKVVTACVGCKKALKCSTPCKDWNPYDMVVAPANMQIDTVTEKQRQKMKSTSI